MVCVPEKRRAAVREALASVLDERMGALFQHGSWLTDLRQVRRDAQTYARWLASVLALFYVVDNEPPLGWLAPCPCFLPAMVGTMLSALSARAGRSAGILEECGGTPSLACAMLLAFLHGLERLGAAELARALANGRVLVRLMKAALRFHQRAPGHFMATAAFAAAAAARRPVRGDAERRDRAAALEQLGQQVVAEMLHDGSASQELRGAHLDVKAFLAPAVLLLLPRGARGRHVQALVVVMVKTLATDKPFPAAPVTLCAKELVWNRAAQALHAVGGALQMATAVPESLALALNALTKALDRIGGWLSLEAVPGAAACAAALLDDVRGAPEAEATAWRKEAVRGVGAGIERAAVHEPDQIELWRLVCSDGTQAEAAQRRDLYNLMRERDRCDADVARRVAERYQPDAADLSSLRTATFFSLMAVARDLLDAHAGAGAAIAKAAAKDATKDAAEGAAEDVARLTAEVAAGFAEKVVAKVLVARILDRAAAAGNLRCAALLRHAPPVSALADEPLAWQAAATLLAAGDEGACLAGLVLLHALLQCCAGLAAPPRRAEECKRLLHLLAQEKLYGEKTQAAAAALCGVLRDVVEAHPEERRAAETTARTLRDTERASIPTGFAQSDTCG